MKAHPASLSKLLRTAGSSYKNKLLALEQERSGVGPPKPNGVAIINLRCAPSHFDLF